MAIFKDLLKVWRIIFLIFVPVVASPILTIDGSKEMACLFGVVIMASFWITEVLPIAVTALLPVVLFPALGVLPGGKVAASYIKDATMFSFSCLTFALCVERWNLHRRIALRTLLLMGSSPKWLMLGFMLPTWFLSMWVNNTSATAMMVPVIIAVLDQLHELEISKQVPGGTDVVLSKKETDANKAPDEKQEPMTSVKDNFRYPNEEFRHLCVALSLSVCYSAGLGGTASITGSSTNLVMQGQADLVFAAYDLQSDVNFLTWFMCCFPGSVLCLIVAWLWLVFHFFGVRELIKFGCGDKEKTAATRKVIKQQLAKLGPLSFAEKAVIGHFIVLVSLWLSMKFPGGSGWYIFFKKGFVKNSTPGILVVLSLFIFPCDRPKVFCCHKKSETPVDGTEKEETIVKSVAALMDWKTIQEHFPWGTWILLGAGYALANACQESGLSYWLSSRLSMLSNLEPWVMVLILSLSVSFMTEITSNAATASILCPILADLAISLQLHPLYLLFPSVLACSLAFILPVATPPNAIVFATGHVTVKDMAKAGAVLNILCVLIVNVAVNTWMKAILQLDTLPPEMDRRFTSLYPLHETEAGTVNHTQFSAFNQTLKI